MSNVTYKHHPKTNGFLECIYKLEDNRLVAYHVIEYEDYYPQFNRWIRINDPNIITIPPFAKEITEEEVFLKLL